MGRFKCFSREEVLEKSIPVFWKNGFADTSLPDLEKATGVNRSGLYSEFKDKDDLYVASLKHYIDRSGVQELLSRQPLGWDNIRALLTKAGVCEGQRGCFVVNSVREIFVLPQRARTVVSEHMTFVRGLVVENVKATRPKRTAEIIAEMILTFNAGLCLEQNMKGAFSTDKVEAFLSAVQGL